MAITVTPDWTVINSAESATLWTAVGGQGTSVITLKAQGTNSINSDPNGTGLKGLAHTLAVAVDIRDQHILMWLAIGTNEVNTFANGGHRIRLGATSGTANYREYFVGGNDKGLGSVKGMWNAYCVDPRKAADVTSGTLALNSVRSFGHINNITIVPNGINSLFFNDQIIRGRELHILGTGGDTPAIASNDRTNGRGIFKDVNGIYYALGRFRFGATAAATASDFSDSNRVWNFEDQEISSTFHKLEFVGSSGGINSATFGTKLGTGIAAAGAGGNSFLAGGKIPFHIEAIDALINTGFYGCNFIGSPAARQDNCRFFAQFTGATYTDDTVDAGDPGVGDVLFMPASEGVGDGCVFGHEERFNELNVIISTSGTVGAGVWEYYNGATWSACTNVTDGTNQLKAAAGTYTVTFAMPDDWAKLTVATDRNFYYIRFRVTTVYTVNPVGTLANITMRGDIRFETLNLESIGSNYTSMGSIRVRNGAILRKAVISNSTSNSKCAALDLGSTDPTADTVRDVTILNSTNGIVLKGTSTGTTTYNFRNIKFSGNTNDVLVDFPAAATVVINILDGGDTPSISKVDSGTTVNIVNAVTLTIKCVDTLGAAIVGTNVLLEATTNATVTITRSGAVATVAHTAHGLATGDRVTIRGANQPEYNGVRTITYLTANTYTVPVSGTPITPATGTITATRVFINELTIAGGLATETLNYVSDIAVTGYARKSTTSPFYKTTPMSGTITVAGFSATLTMVSDE